MEKHYKFILENKSDVDQEWRIYPRDPITIHPRGFISYNFIIDTERNISIGLTIDVGESQLATAVKRDIGEDTKFYLFPASHDIAISTYVSTVHIRSTFAGEIIGFSSILDSQISINNLDQLIVQHEAKQFSSSQKLLTKSLSYIDNLTLDFKKIEGRTDLTLEVNEGEKAGFVDSGSLISFVTGIPKLQKNDVLNSTLLAQLAANTAFDRWTNTENWYKKYVEVLENVGWVIESFNFTKYDSHTASFTMDKVVLEILKAIATGQQEAVINETIKALEALSNNDGKLVLFDTNGSNLKQGNFQMSSAQSDGENVAMAMASFYFSSTQSSTRFLWFEYKSADTHLFKASQKVVLNEEIYKLVRSAVIKKLGDAAIQYIADLDIGF